MAYFDHAFFDFMNELSANNRKSWFDANRKRYEQAVKAPFKALVEDMILRIHADDPEVMIPAKDAIFRIHRDIRFSPDKTPYKTHVSAVISPAGRKDLGMPGFYFELSADKVRVAGGAHACDKQHLQAIRSTIAAHPEVFNRVISDPEFREKYGTIRGEKNKRIPPEFKEAAKQQPLLYNKQFYYMAELPRELITSEALGDTLMAYYFAGKPVMQFLREAVKSRVKTKSLKNL
jgi:uncharacterized protein (TIGR02453 family)